MENISDADFWKDLLEMDVDNGTGRWDVSKLVSKMTGNFHRAPRAIANALAAVILASNGGSLLAIGWRDRRRARFTANLRIVASLSVSNMLIGVCALLDNVALVPLVDGNAETCAYVLRKALVNAAHAMSLLNLLALAVDHYVVVCSPMGTFVQRSAKITRVIVTLWMPRRRFLRAAFGRLSLSMRTGLSARRSRDSWRHRQLSIKGR